MSFFLKIIFFLGCLNVFSQGRITIPQAINIISKQSMLSQRMAKDKIYNTNSAHGNKGLLSSTIQFENNLSSLKGIDLSDEITNKVTHLELVWLGYKINIEEDSSKSNREIMDYNGIVLDLCQEISKLFLTTARKQNLYPYNTKNVDFEKAYIATNNLKYATQRLALYFTAYYYKIARYNNEEFEEIIATIDEEVNSIQNIKNTNTEYLQDTNAIESEWKHVKNLLSDIRTKKFISVNATIKPEQIYQKSNKLLKLSDLLSRTYKAVNEINN